jgi:hypothetical protein
MDGSELRGKHRRLMLCLSSLKCVNRLYCDVAITIDCICWLPCTLRAESPLHKTQMHSSSPPPLPQEHLLVQDGARRVLFFCGGASGILSTGHPLPFPISTLFQIYNVFLFQTETPSPLLPSSAVHLTPPSLISIAATSRRTQNTLAAILRQRCWRHKSLKILHQW